MAVGMMLLVVVIIGLVTIGGMAYALRTDSTNTLTSKQKTELRELRALKDRLERLALQNQDVYPDFSYQIRDEIRTYEMKELS